MSKENGPNDRTVADLKSAAQDLLRFLAGPEMSESELFPYGVNAIAITVKNGDAEVRLEIGGPDHAHHDHDEEDDEGWFSEVDELPDLDDDL
jgi:hypothetical protein